MGYRITKKRNRQLTFFFDPSRRAPRQSNSASAAPSTTNHSHSPPVTSSADTWPPLPDARWCAFCQRHHERHCPYADPGDQRHSRETTRDRRLHLVDDRRR